MILLPLLLLLAIGAGVGVFIASLLRSDGDDPGRTIGRLAPIGLALGVGVVALVVVEGVLVFGLRGLGGSDGEDASDAAPDTTTTVVAVEPEPARDAIAADVEMTFGGAGFEPPPVLSGVDDGGVLVVRASSFPNDSRGTISWCDERGCHDRFPVQFDGDGGALVQYELDVPDGSCRRARQCALRIDSDDGAATAALFVGVSAPTVPRARLAHPGRELQPGDAIALELVGVGFDSVNVL